MAWVASSSRPTEMNSTSIVLYASGVTRLLLSSIFKKKQRDRLIRLAAAHSEGVLGFADDIGWSRLAQPELHAWAEDKPIRL
jgi:hypothetical protein